MLQPHAQTNCQTADYRINQPRPPFTLAQRIAHLERAIADQQTAGMAFGKGYQETVALLASLQSQASKEA